MDQHSNEDYYILIYIWCPEQEKYNASYIHKAISYGEPIQEAMQKSYPFLHCLHFSSFIYTA